MTTSVPSNNKKKREYLGKQLTERYRSPLISFFLRRVSNRAEAEDLTQEVFVRVLAKADNDEIHNVEAFLFSAATNLLRDRARRETIRQNYLQSASADIESCVEELSPERVTLGEVELESILGGLAELSERCRDIFILHRLEHLKNREIAQLYDISVSAVEKQLTKAVAHLMKLKRFDEL